MKTLTDREAILVYMLTQTQRSTKSRIQTIDNIISFTAGETNLEGVLRQISNLLHDGLLERANTFGHHVFLTEAGLKDANLAWKEQN